MTGGSYLPLGDLETAGGIDPDAHSVQWMGTPSVKGPKWAKLPLLTVGMLGTQVVWSIEMGYASPFLLELGLSKSWMSLVFMAGPLSGLIVQPLIGAYADRSRSKFGRRRPFMLIGTGVAVFGMLLLAYSREVAGLFGITATWGAIACAVLAIYLIDFSINAVMSTDRALIVDTLPPTQQEAANAWGGRMCGIGGVAGFFVGNMDLTGVSYLGKSQLQVLSLLTSTVLALAHTSTSWAVTERILLRDDRPQSRSGLISSLRAIWSNMFTLPPGIRTVCFIQFFANLGWYPILFFTSIWVADIYKIQYPQGDLAADVWEADAVRAGSRALFLQSVVALAVSVGAPFLVSDSGVQSKDARHTYLSIHNDDDDDGLATPNSATWKREVEERSTGSWSQKAAEVVAAMIKGVKSGSAWALPIPGLTLIKLWFIAQCVFACCMLATWFSSSVGGAYTIIAVTGFSWSLAQWAPYALLGELVLIDAPERSEMHALQRATPTMVVFATESHEDSPVHSRAPTRTHMRNPSHEVVTPGQPHALSRLVLPGSDTPPEREQDSTSVELDLDTTVILRHSDELSELSEAAPLSPPPNDTAPSTADKAGLILGIHNVFIVLPQFVITFVSSIVFKMMEEPTTAQDRGNPVSATEPVAATAGASSPNAVGLVFRVGGTAAVVGAYLSYRLGRRWAAGLP